MAKLASTIILSLGLIGCCQAERRSIENLEKTHNLILPKYIRYVQNDASLSQEAKDDEIKLVESLKRLTEAIKRNTE